VIPFRCTSIALLLAGCAANASAPNPQASGPARIAAPGDVLGSVDGVELRRADLPKEAALRLQDNENELLQRQLHLQWAGFEEAVDVMLVEREAKRRGMSADELRAAEIDAKLTKPSDEEVRAMYDENRDVIEVPFDVAAPYIRRQIEQHKREELERAFASELRKGVDVRYALPVPELPRRPIDTANAPSEGPNAAVVTLVEFSDFQCPYCARAKTLVNELRELYPSQLRIVYRDFPLSQHPQARAAAEAAHCAHEQNKFWPYHDLLFDNQHALSSEDLKRYAGEVALDLSVFEKCLASERPKLAIKTSEELGKEYGVEGTPALFLNGMKLIGVMPLPLMKLIIDRELERAGGDS
jgi:protein-disulfide isomerase